MRIILILIITTSVLVLGIVALVAPSGNRNGLNRIMVGECERVVDGDTLLLLNDKRRVRLAYIDAPELNQTSFDYIPIGKWSKDFLRKIVEGKKIRMEVLGQDQYSRLLAKIWVLRTENAENADYGELSAVNYQLIKNGHAVLYPFSTFSSKWEKSAYLWGFYWAKWNRHGMWSTLGFSSPYHYRKQPL
ncbi:MAG: thermonuclease family protein [Oligoflexia bacterium]|nr:thermonuclease family protein [Oligoflexia bacterium]